MVTIPGITDLRVLSDSRSSIRNSEIFSQLRCSISELAELFDYELARRSLEMECSICLLTWQQPPSIMRSRIFERRVVGLIQVWVCFARDIHANRHRFQNSY
jgi:hypothetical protein